MRLLYRNKQVGIFVWMSPTSGLRDEYFEWKKSKLPERKRSIVRYSEQGTVKRVLWRNESKLQHWHRVKLVQYQYFRLHSVKVFFRREIEGSGGSEYLSFKSTKHHYLHICVISVRFRDLWDISFDTRRKKRFMNDWLRYFGISTSIWYVSDTYSRKYVIFSVKNFIITFLFSLKVKINIWKKVSPAYFWFHSYAKT